MAPPHLGYLHTNLDKSSEFFRLAIVPNLKQLEIFDFSDLESHVLYDTNLNWYVYLNPKLKLAC